MLLRWLLLLVAITLSRAQDTPTEVPSAVPTVMPTVNPSETSTKTPSAVPTTAMPTAPIETPTATPTATPTTATPTTAVPTLIEDCRTYPLFSNCSSCVEDGHHWCSDGGGYGDYCFNGNDDACFGKIIHMLLPASSHIVIHHLILCSYLIIPSSRGM